MQNESEIVAEFDKITGEVVSCSYTLDEEPKDPQYVEVTLDGEPLYLDQPDGWSISGKTVTVRGNACQKLQDGGDHALALRVLCEIVIPE
ncbi:hypothetical protein ACMHYB_21730 [Sorangium sp. So ce1128]